MLDRPLTTAKLNAAKNILRGRITVNRSCLTPRQTDELIIAANAYLLDDKQILPNDELKRVIGIVIGKQHHRITDTIRFFYDLIQQMISEGEKLQLEALRVIVKDRVLDKVIVLNRKTFEASVDPDVVIREENELQEIKAQLEAEKKRMAEFINRLIDGQKQACDEYFARYNPYKRQHNRRFDFEVKNQRKTAEQFQEELRPIFGDNLVCKEYVNSKTLAQMYCHKHDHNFPRMPLHLLKGYGCPHCNKEEGKTWANTVMAKCDPTKRNDRWTTERFIQESINRFGEGVFDYSKVNYINNDTRVTLIRLKDGKEINVFPYEHLRQREDYDGERRFYEGKTNEEKIHYLVRAIHENLEHRVYVPYQDIPDMRKTLRCICPLHGEFPTHIQQIYNGHCCPECTDRGESIGERNVRRYLMERHIPFKQEHQIYDEAYFPEYARIDFYLAHRNIFIEFQGEQHYGIGNERITHNSRTYKEQIERDNAVRRYAADHGIQLIEIPYQFRNDVGTFLDKYKLA